MSVTAYQQRGRSHIRYINRRAHCIWEKHGYKNELWIFCIKEALKQHIKYLEDADRINREVEERENRRCEEKQLKRDSSIYWRNQTTGEWEPLVV